MPKACDACQVSSAVVYCRADAAYLCVSCDSKVHGANKLASRHERVWVCEVCELAPAVVTCKADAAALCVSCDAEIHSANPLARRHERLPITPFYECPSMIKVAHIHSAVMGSGAAVNTGLELMPHKRTCSILQGLEEDENTAAEAASWLLSRPHRTAGQLDLHQEQSLSLTGDAQYPVNLGSSIPRPQQQIHGRMPKPKSESQPPDLFSDVDPYLDLDYAQKAGIQSVVTDSIVPIHSSDVPHHLSPSISNASASIELRLHSKQHPYSTAGSHCVSTSSLEAGVVPDASEISTSYDPASVQFEFPPRVLHVGQLQPMAREARVMRYREKRKNRKFEKTIRYASRKAYAESRPRIKGRFAKRDEKETSESLYGIVPEPSFQSSF